jgi:hypothetical protein
MSTIPISIAAKIASLKLILHFLDNEFDDIVLYAYSRIGDNILVTDDGWTIDNLESNGLSFDKRSKTRNNILTDTLDIFGVQKDQGSKKLYIRTDFDGFLQPSKG